VRTWMGAAPASCARSASATSEPNEALRRYPAGLSSASSMGVADSRASSMRMETGEQGSPVLCEREETGSLVAVQLDGVELGLALGAVGLRLEAAGPKAAAGGRVDGRGDVAGEDDPPPLQLDDGVGDGDGREQGGGVGVLGAPVQLVGAGDLDQLAQV